MPAAPRLHFGLYTFVLLGGLLAPPICSAISDLAVMQFQEIYNQGMEGMRQPDGSYRPSGPDFNERIDEARRAFWEQRAAGRDDPEARRKFVELLAEKDIMLMIASLIDASTEESVRDLGGKADPTQDPSPGLRDVLWAGIIRGTDHGVRPLATRAFVQWREVVERRFEELRPKSDVLTKALTAVPAAGLALQQSLEAEDPEFLAYIAVRDRAEELAALGQFRFDSGREYLLKRLELETGDSAAASDWWEDIEAAVGARRMEAIAARLMQAPKNRDGAFEEPAFVDAAGEELWLATKERAERLAGNLDAKLYALWQIRRQQDVGWTEAQRIFRTYWTEPFGERATLEAAETVRTARKAVRRGKEILADEIANRSDPEYALAYLMPYFPYRDKPLGSLNSKDPQAYLYALLKDNAGVEHWIDVPEAYETMAGQWGEATLLDAARRVIAARKDGGGRIAAPSEIGVTATDPWQALQELLGQTQSRPDRYFSNLARDAGWTWTRGGNSGFSDAYAMDEYQNLTRAYGSDKVESAVTQVRRAMESGVDLSTLDGVVSGTTAPLPAIYEILWSTSSAEQYLDFLGRLGSFKQIYFPQYGKDTTLAAVAKIIKAPKQLDSLNELYANRGNVLLASRASVGLPESSSSAKSALSVTNCLFELARQEAERLASLPLEEGQHLRGRGNGRAGEILRVFEGDQGIQYLVNDSGSAYWQTHDEVRRYWEPAESPRFPMRKPPEPDAQANPWPAGSKVQAQVGGHWRDGVVLFYEGRPQMDVWAVRYEAEDAAGGEGGLRLLRKSQLRDLPGAAATSAGPTGEAESNPFPIGSKVQLTYGRELCEGTVTDYNERQGWLVEFRRRTGAMRTWFRPNMIQRYELRLLDSSGEAASTTRADPTFAVGSKVRLEQRGQSIEFTVVEVQGEGRSERVKLEYWQPGARRPSQRWMLASQLEAAVEAQ